MGEFAEYYDDPADIGGMEWGHDFACKAVVYYSGFVTRIYFSRFPGRQILDKIKKFGGTWNDRERYWSIDADKWPRVRQDVLQWAQDGTRMIEGSLFGELSREHYEWLNPWILERGLSKVIPPSEVVPLGGLDE